MTEKNGGLMERLAQMVGLKPQQASLLKFVVMAVAVGVLFLNAGSIFGVTDTGRNPPSDATEVVAPPVSGKDEISLLEEAIAADLERTLSIINGAGRVQVAVTLESGPRVTPLQNTQEEKTTVEENATDGSTRRTDTIRTDQNNVMTRDGNQDLPAIAMRSRAQIAGVLIVAEGARHDAVRARLHEAAMTALGIPAHRITVVPAEGR